MNNNPESNLKSPMSRPPATKKQRGGATPTPTPRGVSHIPTTTSGTSTTTSLAGTTFSTNEGQRRLTMAAADDAIARRRAELRRLQAKRSATTTTTTPLSSKGGSTGSTSSTSYGRSSQTPTTSTAPPPPPPPMRPAGVGRHDSDLFPTVPKSPSPQITRQTLLDVSEASGTPTISHLTVSHHYLLDMDVQEEGQDKGKSKSQKEKEQHHDHLKQPTLPLLTTTTTTGTTTGTTTKSSSSTTAAATTTTSSSRAKSAPPVRPPPPPLPPKEMTKTKPSVTTPATSSSSHARLARVNKAKPEQRRPHPITPSTLMVPTTPTTSSSTTTTTTTKPSSPARENKHSSQYSAARSFTEPPQAPKQKESSPVANKSSHPIITSTSNKPTMSTPTTNSIPSPPSGPPSSSSSSKRDKINQMLHAVAQANEKAAPAAAAPAVAAAPEEEAQTNTSMSLVSPTKKDEPPIPARRPAPSPESATTTNTTNTTTNTTTVPPLISESQQRLEQVYHKAEQDKSSALLRIKELEDLLLQANQKMAEAVDQQSLLPPPGSHPTIDYHYMLQLAETDGPQAALEWAKNQQPHLTSNNQHLLRGGTTTATTHMTGMSSWRNIGVGPPPSPRRFPRRAMTTATTSKSTVQPILLNIPPNVSMVQVEKQFLPQFQEAVQYVPYQFTSSLATYVVRRPYGTITEPELFDQLSLTSDEVYRKRAHVTELSALEVGVTIVKDQSSLLLFDKVGVRYKTPTSSDWKVIGNVEEDLDRPLLGYVTYIDEQANELEYSLDDVLDEALMVREQYSSAIINMALGLKDRPVAVTTTTTTTTTNTEKEVAPALNKVPSNDVAVETDEKGMMTAPATTIHVEPSSSAKVDAADADTTKATTKDSSPPPPTTNEETTGSSDMLTWLMSMILSSVFRLIYFVLIGLPWRIVQTVVIMTAVYIICNMIYWYLAEDYNHWLIRESGGGTVTFTDLAHFANNNMRHGIM